MRAKTIAAAAAIALALPVAADAAQRSSISRPAAEQTRWPGSGVTVEEVVPHTAAAGAGIRRGDVIVSINGTPVNGYPDLDAQVAASDGRPLAIDLYRHGRHLRIRAAPRSSAGLNAYGVPQQDRALGIAHWEERLMLIPCALEPDCE